MSAAGFCLGRVYSLTMLFNLNSRAGGRKSNSNTDTREGDTGYGLRNMNNTDVGAISESYATSSS